jgi:SIR2-like domain
MADSDASRSQSIHDLPYEAIASSLRHGDLIPFLGAGASASVDVAGASKIPLGSELSRDLANFFGLGANRGELGLPLVAEYIEQVGSGRDPLRRRLRQTFYADFQYGKLHEYLASIDKHMLILTTNYDDLIEKAFDARNKPYDLVVHMADNREQDGAVMIKRRRRDSTGQFAPLEPKELEINLDDAEAGASLIFKMHGHCDRSLPPDVMKNDHFVVSEEDYTKYLANISSAVPRAILTALRNKGFLFFGYGLRDWNLRVMLWMLNCHKSASRSYGIRRDTSPDEEEIWQGKGIKLFNGDINQVVDRLRAY